MNYVDFHCHLDLYPDFAAAVHAAELARVYTLTVTTTPRAWPRNYELTKNTKYVRAALGLHPQLVTEHPQDIDIWDRYIDQTRFVGEVGIDSGPRHYRSVDAQKAVFEHILKRCALSGPKILTVHSVRAVKTVLDYIERFLPLAEHSIVFHWFTGSISEMTRAAELGCYFSVNAQMLVGERGRSLVKQIPSDRLLTETDGPFTECLGRPASPADIPQTLHALAHHLDLTQDQVGSLVSENLRRLIAPPTWP